MRSLQIGHLFPLRGASGVSITLSFGLNLTPLGCLLNFLWLRLLWLFAVVVDPGLALACGVAARVWSRIFWASGPSLLFASIRSHSGFKLRYHVEHGSMLRACVCLLRCLRAARATHGTDKAGQRTANYTRRENMQTRLKSKSTKGRHGRLLKC